MNFKTLNCKLDKLHSDYELKRKSLIKKYCDQNNPYKVGDVFTDDLGSILIEEIDYVIHIPMPCCAFSGPRINKSSGKVGKNRRTAFLNRDIHLKMTLSPQLIRMAKMHFKLNDVMAKAGLKPNGDKL